MNFLENWFYITDIKHGGFLGTETNGVCHYTRNFDGDQSLINWHLEMVEDINSEHIFQITNKKNNLLLALDDSGNVFQQRNADVNTHWVISSLNEFCITFANKKYGGLLSIVDDFDGKIYSSKDDDNNLTNWRIQTIINKADRAANNKKQDEPHEPLFSTHKWMGDLKSEIGNIDLRELKIPGTHNSGSFIDFTVFQCVCQNHDIGFQLDIGVRFFDIRLMEYNSEICMHHNGNTIIQQNFPFAARQIAEYLENFPNELVILKLTNGNGSNITSKDTKKLKKVHEIIKKWLTPFVIENNTENQAIIKNKFTLSALVRKTKNSTNQLLLVTADKTMINLKAVSEENFYWDPMWDNTWEKFMSAGFGDFKCADSQTADLKKHLEDKLTQRIKLNQYEKMLTCDAYLYNLYYSTRTMAEKSRNAFDEIIKNATPKQRDSINVVLYDFIEKNIAYNIIKLNLQSNE